jgi:hypothetical protein
LFISNAAFFLFWRHLRTDGFERLGADAQLEICFAAQLTLDFYRCYVCHFCVIGRFVISIWPIWGMMTPVIVGFLWIGLVFAMNFIPNF